MPRFLTGNCDCFNTIEMVVKRRYFGNRRTTDGQTDGQQTDILWQKNKGKKWCLILFERLKRQK